MGSFDSEIFDKVLIELLECTCGIRALSKTFMYKVNKGREVVECKSNFNRPRYVGRIFKYKINWSYMILVTPPKREKECITCNVSANSLLEKICDMIEYHPDIGVEVKALKEHFDGLKNESF